MPWANGGNTDLDNLRLLCRTHHRITHEQRRKRSP
ncbi:MAG: HNH endonuclease signature motif containing protein [Pseudonocardiaceae bacterium]